MEKEHYDLNLALPRWDTDLFEINRLDGGAVGKILAVQAVGPEFRF